MHFTVYEIKNILTGKTYVGRHKTENLDDGYMGSGSVISRLVSDAPELFTKRIIRDCASEQEMYNLEHHIVTEEFIKTSYNQRPEGAGSWETIIQFKPEGDTFVPIGEIKNPLVEKSKSISKSKPVAFDYDFDAILPVWVTKVPLNHYEFYINPNDVKKTTKYTNVLKEREQLLNDLVDQYLLDTGISFKSNSLSDKFKYIDSDDHLALNLYISVVEFLAVIEFFNKRGSLTQEK